MKKDGTATTYGSFNAELFATLNDDDAYKMSIDGSKIFAPFENFGTNITKLVPNIFSGNSFVCFSMIVIFFCYK